MVSKDFAIGDLVWAKMKGFPPWPGKIAVPDEKVKAPKLAKPQHFVYFFGTKNYAWILDENIQSHSDKMMANTKTYKKRSAALQSAIKEIQGEVLLLEDKDEAGPSEEDNEAQPSDEEEDSGPSNKDNEASNKDKDESGPSDEDNEPGSSDSDNEAGPSSKRASSPLPSPRKNPPKKIKLSLEPLIPAPEVRPKKVKISVKKPASSSLFPAKKKSTPSRDRLLAGILPPTAAGRHKKKKNAFPSSVVPHTTNNNVAVIPPYAEVAGGSIIHRPHYPRPPTPPLRFDSPVSEVIRKRKALAFPKRIGFLGLGMIGRGVVKNLLQAGHDVTVWNRTQDKCNAFLVAGARQAPTPQDVVTDCDVTFCCVADSQVTKKLVFGNCGVLCALRECGAKGGSKGFVEMTSLDAQTSQEVAEAVSERGGRYLEAPVMGSRQLAEEGKLLVLAAGDRELYDECAAAFTAMATKSFYMSCDVGHAARMNTVFSMMRATTMANLAEAVALVEGCKMSSENFMEIMAHTEFGHALWVEKCRAMLGNNYALGTALKHQQKELTLAICLGNDIEQPVSVAAAACEVFKRAKQLCYQDHDVSAVHLGVRV